MVFGFGITVFGKAGFGIAGFGITGFGITGYSPDLRRIYKEYTEIL